jgi:PPOX class probable FMN-dependent enzyme
MARTLAACRAYAPALVLRAGADMITSLTSLRALYQAPKEIAVRKQLTALDPHCMRFIELSPFIVVATSDSRGFLDSSPRGGAPGFVQVADHQRLLLPDSPGNNRLDSFSNIIETGQIGLLFMIPGVDETLRVNGSAMLRDEAEFTERCRDERRVPKVVIEVQVREAYLHCAKAFMRSQLWSDAARVKRSCLPSISEMVRDQVNGDWAIESQEQMVARYQTTL